MMYVILVIDHSTHMVGKNIHRQEENICFYLQMPHIKNWHWKANFTAMQNEYFL